MITNRLVNFVTSSIGAKYLTLIFFHIIGDFLLQTNFLARAKSIQYWKDIKKIKDNVTPDRDWIMPMLAHCLLWSFCVHYPIIISSKRYILITISICIHTAIHFCIDNGKTNLHSYTLVGDQTFHILQLLLILFI